MAFDGMSKFTHIFPDGYSRYYEGWFAARLESRFPMMVFLGLSALYLIGLGLMFISPTFRWTFVEWGFFGSMVIVSGLLILVGLVVGVMCRMNFGKGLPQYRKRTAVPLWYFFYLRFLFQ
jgi:hypothetical protein